MKDSDEELKDFFSANPPDGHFDFDPDNWEKFSASLKNKRKDRKRLFIYLNLLLLAIGITTTWLLMEKETGIQQKGPIAYKPAKDKLLTNHTKQIKHGFSTGDVKKTLHRSSEQFSADKTPASANNNLSPVNKDVSWAKNRQALPAAAKSPGETSQNRAILHLAMKQSPARIKRELPNENKTAASASADADVKTEGNFSAVLTQRTTTKTLLPASEQSSLSPGLQPVKEDAPANKTFFENKNVQETTATDVTQGATNLSNEKETVSISTPADQNALTTESLVLTPLADSALLSSQGRKDSLPKEVPSKNLLFVELGTDYLFGWNNNGKTEANGFNPVIGLLYQNTFTDKLALSLGLRYQSISNFSGTSHTSAVTALKFGEESYITVISPLRAHYIAAPLKLNYLLNSKNSIGLGFTIAYLLDVESKVETYLTSKDRHEDLSVSKSMGYKTGFNSTDGQIAFCYRRHLYKNLYINCELFYGVKDIKKNLVYHSAVFERSRGMKLTLTYNLIKK